MEIEKLEQPAIANQEEKGLRIRRAEIMQQEEYLSEDKIKSVFLAYKSIEKWAYIKHDKDIDQETKEQKKPHWHIVLIFKNAAPINQIAKWFGIEPQYVSSIKGGRNAFIQCCEYLTHENEKQQELGKHRYEDSEVFSNFNFREELDKYLEDKLLKNTGLGKLELRKRVLADGLKLSQIDMYDLSADYSQLVMCRREYIKNYAPLPSSRINFYITGSSETGKSLSSRALAKTLVDPTNQLKDKEVYFIVGQGKSLFQGYDGQPVLIWDDLRAFDLLKYYDNNVGAIFNLFDVIPSSSEQNVKFSSVKLINSINIINSIETFEEFCKIICHKNSFCETPEPDKQIYRRFPFFIELSASQKYDFFVNSRFFDANEPNYKAYLAHKNMGIGLMKITNAYKNDDKKRIEMTNKHFDKVDKEHKKAVAKFVDDGNDILDLQKQLELEVIEMDNQVVETERVIVDERPTKTTKTIYEYSVNKKPPF